ncbi:hypothetical protein [Acinetobacter lwoffii]|uniref:hypothetical protein n=1 Tax=Acinetobacter lwoffii TaxID=28090 RepID=UPI003BF72240
MTPAQQAEQADINLATKQIEDSTIRIEKLFKYIAYGLYAFGAILCLTIFLIPVGILLAIVGFLMKKFGSKIINAELDKKRSEIRIRQTRLDEEVAHTNAA